MEMNAKGELGQVATGLSLEQKDAIVIDITPLGVKITIGEGKRVDACILRDLIVGGLNGYLKELDIKCLCELKEIHKGI